MMSVQRQTASLHRHLWVALLCAAVLPSRADSQRLEAPASVEPRSSPADTLRVDDRAAVAVWPAVRVLADSGNAYTAEQLIDQRQRFNAPGGTAGNLGRRTGTIWLRIPVVVPGTQQVRRVLEIDYPALNQADLYVLHEGVVQSHYAMGNHLVQSERALPTRTHAAPLLLAPGDYELLLRVHTLSSVVLPITLRTSDGFTRYESQVQLVQGIVIGLALCMLLYSLAHWVSLRDTVFLDYALLLVGNMVFTLSYFGIGAQYLWPDWPRASMQIAPMGVMVAVAAGARFTRATLAVSEISRPIDWILRGAGVAAVLGLAGTLAGLVSYRSAQALVTVLGILVTVAVIPAAAIRVLRGERIAGYVLFGWAFYSAGALTMAGILRGMVEPTFWSQHVYPFSTMVEMSAWMAVLGLRVKAIHRNADRARLESETLRTLAHTDVLTGLPNRRGLHEQLAPALRTVGPQRMLAVFLMDLDGFKPVNDRYGHDVGDALLVAVSRRLQAQLRGQDVVSRLGGDEFVVLAGELPDEAAAQSVGEALLAVFDQPFDLEGQRCEVGVTIGYALAPLDGHTADELLKRADAAMYAGKQQGRHRMQRGGRAMLGVSMSA